MGLSGSESLPHWEKEVGEPTSEAGGVGSSFFTSVTLSTSMATRSLRDSEERHDRKMSRAVIGQHCSPEVDFHSIRQLLFLDLDLINHRGREE